MGSSALTMTVLLALGQASSGPPLREHVPDAFRPGLRWRHVADPARPWIPRDVELVDGGELVWAAPAVANPGLLLLASGDLPGAGPLLSAELPGAIGEVSVAAGEDPRSLFAIHQLPCPRGFTRKSIAQRFDVLDAGGAPGVPPVPVWSHDMERLANGPAAIAVSDDGSGLAVALLDASLGEVQLDFLDVSTGALSTRTTVAGYAPPSLVLSSSGDRAVLGTGSSVVVFDAGGNPLWSTSTSAHTVAVSSDGLLLALGLATSASLLRDEGGGYAPILQMNGRGNEVLAAIALASDGSTAAFAWWNASSGNGVRFEVCDVATGLPTNHLAQSGSPSGLQNYPSALRISEDGSRIACGLWGAGDARPELVLLARGVSRPVAEVDLPGSVYALAIDRGGTRMAVGIKDTHANLLSSSGEIRLYDTGERDLVLGRPLRHGESSEITHRVHGPGQVVFVVGMGLSSPVRLPFLRGDLWIDLATPFQTFPVERGPWGAATLSLLLPPDPSLAGLTLTIQAYRMGLHRPVLARTHLEGFIF